MAIFQKHPSNNNCIQAFELHMAFGEYDKALLIAHRTIELSQDVESSEANKISDEQINVYRKIQERYLTFGLLLHAENISLNFWLVGLNEDTQTIKLMKLLSLHEELQVNLEKGNYDECIEIVNKKLQLASQSFTDKFLKVACLVKTGRIDDALRSKDSMVQGLEDNRRRSQAIGQLNLLLKLNDITPLFKQYIYLDLARLHIEFGKARAATFCRKALEIDPTLKYAEIYRFHALRSLHGYNHAQADREKILAKSNAIFEAKSDASIAARMANSEHLKGRHDLAYKDYNSAISRCTEAIDLSPTIARFFITRAECYIETGRVDLAIEDMNMAFTFETIEWRHIDSALRSALAHGAIDIARGFLSHPNIVCEETDYQRVNLAKAQTDCSEFLRMHNKAMRCYTSRQFEECKQVMNSILEFANCDKYRIIKIECLLMIGSFGPAEKIILTLRDQTEYTADLFFLKGLTLYLLGEFKDSKKMFDEIGSEDFYYNKVEQLKIKMTRMENYEELGKMKDLIVLRLTNRLYLL